MKSFGNLYDGVWNLWKGILILRKVMLLLRVVKQPVPLNLYFRFIAVKLIAIMTQFYLDKSSLSINIEKDWTVSVAWNLNCKYLCSYWLYYWEAFQNHGALTTIKIKMQASFLTYILVCEIINLKFGWNLFYFLGACYLKNSFSNILEFDMHNSWFIS